MEIVLLFAVFRIPMPAQVSHTSIKGFMAFYRQTFPQVSEERMWVSWQAGSRKYTLLEPTYSSISDRLIIQKICGALFMESCPFPARRWRKTEWLSFTSGTPHIYIKHKTTVILYSRDICSNYNYIQTKWSKIRSILHTKR